MDPISITEAMLARSADAGPSEAATSMVARVALIMSSFERAGRLMRLDQVVSRTGLPRSSVHRILTQLHKAGLLQHRPDGYCVAASALGVSPVADHAALRGAAAAVLERLQADTGLVVHLGVLAGGDVVYLDKLGGSGAVAVPTRVTGHSPAHASALGKALLAQLSAEQVDAIFGDGLRKCTPATIADIPTLHQELARIRSRHGLAYDDQELAVGLSSAAVPIRVDDGESASVSLTGALPAHRLQRLAPFLTRAARGIADRLGSAAPSSSAGTVAITDDMMSRVLRTLSSDDWV